MNDKQTKQEHQETRMSREQSQDLYLNLRKFGFPPPQSHNSFFSISPDTILEKVGFWMI